MVEKIQNMGENVTAVIDAGAESRFHVDLITGQILIIAKDEAGIKAGIQEMQQRKWITGEVGHE